MAKRAYPSYLIYIDQAGEYRWRYQAENGQILADSGEGYVTKRDCRHGLDRVRNSSGDAVYRDTGVEAG
jgi:uncharacterized protein YegP (UPF0339 family)